MEKPAYYPFKIRAIEIDHKQRLSIPALTNMLQQAAWQHATQLGVSTYSLMEEGLTWVLSRFKVQIDHSLKHLQEVNVKTWPAGAEGLRAYRGFQLLKPDGNILATAESVWLIVDMKKKQVQPIPEFIKKFKTDPKEGDFHFSNSIPELTKVDYTYETKAGWFDLDINKHVNNNHYIKWLTESFPYDFLNTHQLHKLEIVYTAECFYNDNIEAKTQSTGNGEFIHSLVKNGSTELIRATSSWID